MKILNVLKNPGHLVLFLFVSLLVATACTQPKQNQLNPADFKTPPASAHIHTWWHWVDGNISKEGVTKDLEAMKKQGIVEATIINAGIFKGKDFGIKPVDFNTPEWYGLFQWALKEANRLGIAIGIHNCDGWSSSGGPWITPEMSMKQYEWTKTIVDAAQTGTIKLRQPMARQGFYKDVAVVAFKTGAPQSSFQQAAPVVLLNESTNADVLFDGSLASSLKIARGDKITFNFKEPFVAEKIAIMPHKLFSWKNVENYTSTYRLSSSIDGKNYKPIAEFTVKGLNKMVSVAFEKTAAKFFQLTLVEPNDLDMEFGMESFEIAECELLAENESPLYADKVNCLWGKACTGYLAGEDIFVPRANAPANENEREVIDLSTKMESDGTLNWKPTTGNWAVIRFGYTTTGSVNSHATPFGKGLECDKMDTAAVNFHFKNYPEKLIKMAGPLAGNTFKFMLIDSWEVGFPNWTAGMLKEFGQRRGYSLLPYIPVLCGESSGNPEVDDAVLFDFRKTIADLFEQNYYKHFGELLHRNKMGFHAEVIYGNVFFPPVDILKATQYVDVPMFEFWTETDDRQNVTYNPASRMELRYPSYASADYEQPVIAAEAYTGFAHYSETPAQLKPFGDRAYCSGINQLVLHSYVQQPDDSKPGMTLGEYGSHFNRNNSTWPFMSEWFNYQSRIQCVLQQGTPVYDVMYYLGDQLPQDIFYSKSNELPFGYQFGACNFDVLKNRIEVTDGKMILNRKTSYSVLSLAPYGSMNFETLQRIEELVKAGVIVYGPKPQRMLSLNDMKNNRAAFEELTGKIWGKVDGKKVFANRYGKGKVYWGKPLSEVLKTENILPDLATGHDDGNSLMYIHKKLGGNDVYFVMNQQNRETAREISFRITGKTPEIWDPETGNATQPSVYSMDQNCITLPVSLKPYQSLLFIFRNQKPAKYICEVTMDGQKVFPLGNSEKVKLVPEITVMNGAFEAASTQWAGNYELIDNEGKTHLLKLEKRQEFVVKDYSGKIIFEPGYPANIAPVEYTQLRWLSDSENPEVKFFSGTAKYMLSFKFPVSQIQQADSVLLDVGEFGAIARISLNGNDLRIIWKQGMALSVKGLLKPDNLLEVSVADTYRNRFIGDFVQYGKIQNLRTSSLITDFLNKDTPLHPSGLKGPVKIIALAKQALKPNK